MCTTHLLSVRPSAHGVSVFVSVPAHLISTVIDSESCCLLNRTGEAEELSVQRWQWEFRSLERRGLQSVCFALVCLQHRPLFQVLRALSVLRPVRTEAVCCVTESAVPDSARAWPQYIVRKLTHPKASPAGI